MSYSAPVFQPIESASKKRISLVEEANHQHYRQGYSHEGGVLIVDHSHPMLDRYIVPDMPSADELLPYLRHMDANRWYSNFGPLVTQFEDRLTAQLSKEDAARQLYLTTMMTCYDALQIGLRLFRLPENAKVLVPTITFPACPLAVRHAGAEAVLADVDMDTWQLSPAIAKRVSETTRIHAVMPVAVYGVPVHAKAWDAFSKDTGIPVLIDAAAALEAQPVPAHCLVAHSMHATKPFCIGEGGILVSRRAELIEEARCLSNFGTMNRITLKDGVNAKLSEYLGAVALAQLDRWPNMQQKRRQLFAYYRGAIEKSGLPLNFQQGIDAAIVGTLMLQSRIVSAAPIARALNQRGIFAHHMYLPPLHHHPFFTTLKVASVDGCVLQGEAPMQEKTKLMPNAEHMQHSVFGLPFHNFMNESDVDYIVQSLIEIMDQPMVQRARAH